MVNNEGNEDIYTLTDEEGKEEQFELIGTCEYNGNTYYAMSSLDNDSDEYVVLRVENENGEIVLSTVDDDDEFDAVADIFDDEVFADIDYDEEQTEEDE